MCLQAGGPLAEALGFMLHTEGVFENVSEDSITDPEAYYIKI